MPFLPIMVYVSRIGFIVLFPLLWLHLMRTLYPYVPPVSHFYGGCAKAAHDSSFIPMTSYSLCLGLVAFPTQSFAFVLFLMYIALLGNY